MTREPPSIDRLRELFDYDPQEGLLTWRVHRSNRVKQGDEAGTFSPKKNHVYVAVDRHLLRATDIIYALQTGQWLKPEETIVYLGAHDDLRLDNLRVEPRFPTYRRGPVPETDAEAEYREDQRRRRREYMRTYLARRRAAKKELEERRAVRTKTIAGVSYLKGTKRWQATQLPDETLGVRASLVLGTYRTHVEAEDALFELRRGIVYVHDHLPPSPPSRAELAKARAITAGHDGLTLEEAHALWAYDPQTGHFYHRQGIQPGLRADRPSTGKHRFLQHAGRSYPAHFMAWFMTHGYWLPRHSLRWRDRNPHNNALANLYKRIE